MTRNEAIAALDECSAYLDGDAYRKEICIDGHMTLAQLKAIVYLIETEGFEFPLEKEKA